MDDNWGYHYFRKPLYVYCISKKNAFHSPFLRHLQFASKIDFRVMGKILRLTRSREAPQKISHVPTFRFPQMVDFPSGKLRINTDHVKQNLVHVKFQVLLAKLKSHGPTWTNLRYSLCEQWPQVATKSLN